ncbi:MAG: tail fiber domain-containing protein [Gemmatimonadetes bacterium]|nr:tail fiber domain-containing protein [Gemmatimonadota bacterium]
MSARIAAGLVLLLAAPCFAAPRSSEAEASPPAREARTIPSGIPFQGYLEDDGVPVNANELTVDAFLYDAPTNGLLKWGESHSPVSAQDGVFTIQLGESFPLNPNLFGPTPLWLELRVDGQTLTPRTQLLTTPFAMRAAVADVADVAIADDGDWLFNGNTAYRISDVGIGTSAPGARLGVRSDGSGSNELIRLEAPTGPYFTFHENGSYDAYMQCANKNVYVGSRFGDISFHTGGLQRMVVTNDGVGINSNPPTYPLSVSSPSKTAGYFRTLSQSIPRAGVYGEYVSSTALDNRGVIGRSEPVPNYGIGGEFIGGYRAVMATSTFGNGTGVQYGVYSTAGNAAFNYGLFGTTTGSGTGYGVYAAGDMAYTGSLINLSDGRTKRNVTPLERALDTILALEPRSYEYRRDDPTYDDMNLPAGTHYGFVAQEIERVLPDLVAPVMHPAIEEPREGGGRNTTRPNRELKGVKTTELIPILVQAIREQQAMLADQEARIAELEARLR